MKRKEVQALLALLFFIVIGYFAVKDNQRDWCLKYSAVRERAWCYQQMHEYHEDLGQP